MCLCLRCLCLRRRKAQLEASWRRETVENTVMHLQDSVKGKSKREQRKYFNYSKLKDKTGHGFVIHQLFMWVIYKHCYPQSAKVQSSLPCLQPFTIILILLLLLLSFKHMVNEVLWSHKIDIYLFLPQFV